MLKKGLTFPIPYVPITIQNTGGGSIETVWVLQGCAGSTQRRSTGVGSHAVGY